ncbi:MAG: GNAT family N-acetyltransferase [Clostridiales bacterium]|nr:GNAT family N-acetyltransferase [Clostridiales bacterium]
MWEEIEMDPAFLERDACRKAGQPVEIAKTERLLIRETVLSDVPDLYRIWKAPGMGDYVKPLQSALAKELEYMQAYIRHAYSFYDYGLWTVLERTAGQVIGRAGLFPSEILDEAVEMGYLIAREYQRQGLARECGEAILKYAFEVLELSELHLLSDERNTASIRTAEALGFKERESICREGKVLIHYVRYAYE